MSSRSIVDRVLLFAAAVCAAGLVWQLTVLLTSKTNNPSFHRFEAATPAAAQPQATNDQPTAPKLSTVRVVYGDGVVGKTLGKAIDGIDGAPAPQVKTVAFTPRVPAPANPPSVVAVVNPSPATQSAPSVAPLALASLATPVNSSPPAMAVPAAVASPRPDPAPAQTADVASAEPAAPADAAAQTEPAAAPTPDAANESEAKAAPHGAVDINRASVEDLNHLLGAGRIGQAIASHRPYHSIEDLLKKRVVRRSVYEQIKNQLAAE